jgi:general secretion pathway protein H
MRDKVKDEGQKAKGSFVQGFKVLDAKSRSFSGLAIRPSTRSRQCGFSLLELTVVLFVIVLGFSVIGLNLSSGNDSTKIKATARDIVSALRYARGQALMTRQEATVALNLTDNNYTVSNHDKVYQIPEEIDVTVVTAQSELNGEGAANIRFFGDGSSTGGRITLEQEHISWKIDINWLTGQIELESK